MPISEQPKSLLEVRRFTAGYGKIAVLHDVSLTIAPGEAVGLLGPNGAGKTTLLSSISGVIPRSGGTLTFDGQEVSRGNPRKMGNSGLVHVAEGHRVFTQLTVEDNLHLACFGLKQAERQIRIKEVLNEFPELHAKAHDKAGLLSGGQRQMLGVAQGLVRRPRLLMLDEPSAGLSPILVDRVIDIVRKLKETGVAILLVDQLVEKVLSVCDRAYVLSQGKIVLTATTDEAMLAKRIENAYF